jgi:tRNA(Ile)-lysidine synthase
LKPKSARKQNSSVRLAELSETRIALAVSGGCDSMAMLRLALESYPEKSIFILTVDHGLRAASKVEAKQVASCCAELSVPHVVLRWVGDKPKTGIQAKARLARYELMTNWCLQNAVPVLMTAHTADDQTETVYMRQTRTKSLKSLAGIWPTRDWNGIRIVRPVLGFSRSALRCYLTSIQQDWIEDPSNADEKFERVRIRNAIAGQGLNLGDVAERAQAIVSHGQAVAQRWAHANLQIHELGFVTLDRKSFSAAPQVVQDFVLLKILHICGGGQNAELSERLALLEWLKIPAPSRRVLGGAMFMKRVKLLIIGREVGRIAREPVAIPPSGEVIWDGRFRVTGPIDAEIIAAGFGPQMPRMPEIPAFIQAGLPILRIEGKYLPFHQKLEFLRT